METVIEKPDTYMSVKEYAGLKEVSVQAVYKAIKAGKLKSRKIGSFTLVRKE